MPTSSKRHNAKRKPQGRILIVRTSAWDLIRKSRATVATIMQATHALGVISKDADVLHLSETQQAEVQRSLHTIRMAIIVDQTTQETVMQRAELLYSEALKLVNSVPYMKEYQLSESVRGLHFCLDVAVGSILPEVGALCDIYNSIDTLLPQHDVLLRRAFESMNLVRNLR